MGAPVIGRPGAPHTATRLLAIEEVMPKVFAKSSCVVTVGGVVTSVREGQAFDATEEIVREFRHLFDSGVEEATATPGQRRTSR